MPIGFLATEFGVDHEDGVLVTSLGAASTHGGNMYLMLQHEEEHSEQDIALGMHFPYIEYCDQGWSWYGHILEFVLRRTSVEVQMDGEAAKRMQNDGRIVVQFNLSDSQFQELRSALRQTFAGYAYYQDAA